MKKVLIATFSILLVLIAVAAVVIFGFEKPISKNMVGKQIEQVKTYEGEKLEGVDDIPNGTLKLFHESLSYTYDGDSTVTTINEKDITVFTKSGAGDSFKIKVEKTVYTDNGNSKTITNVKMYKDNGKYYQVTDNGEPVEIVESGILLYYASLTSTTLFSYNVDGTSKLKDNIKDMVENNLAKVTQKGLYLKFYLNKDNVSAQLSYKLFAKKITGYNQVTKTYDSDNRVTSKTTYTISL